MTFFKYNVYVVRTQNANNESKLNTYVCVYWAPKILNKLTI